MLPLPDTILMAALVVFVAIIAIFVLHILLGVQQLVRLAEMRRDDLREEQARLVSSKEERLGLRTQIEDERLEQNPQEELNGSESPQDEPKGLESLPIAGPRQEQGQNLEIQHRADKLEEEILQFKQDYRKLEEDLKQVREHQRETDQEKERIKEDLQNIRQILNEKSSSPQAK